MKNIGISISIIGHVFRRKIKYWNIANSKTLDDGKSAVLQFPCKGKEKVDLYKEMIVMKPR